MKKSTERNSQYRKKEKKNGEDMRVRISKKRVHKKWEVKENLEMLPRKR